MSAFLDDHAEDMKDPEYAYVFGRNERELEIIKLLEEASLQFEQYDFNAVGVTNGLIALIKGKCAKGSVEPVKLVVLIKGEK